MSRMDEDYPDFPWIGGFGSMHDLRDAPDREEPRLWHMRSVSRAAALAMAPSEPKDRPRRVGFRIPKARR